MMSDNPVLAGVYLERTRAAAMVFALALIQDAPSLVDLVENDQEWWRDILVDSITKAVHIAGIRSILDILDVVEKTLKADAHGQ
jgi:hypothetical protein